MARDRFRPTVTVAAGRSSLGCVSERQRIASGFELPLPATEALWLFTPEGERVWVPHWNPHYPAGRPSEDSGTVFVTTAEGITTTWVIMTIDRTAHSATYARVTPGRHAGTVRVSCADTRPGYCSVTVAYDLTSLDDADPAVLDAYRPAAFAQMMESWAAAIGAYLEK